MLTILLILLVIAALGGFGRSSWRDGWYGGAPQASPANVGPGGYAPLLWLIVAVVLVSFLLMHSAVPLAPVAP